MSEIFQSIPLGNLLSSADGSNIHDVLKCYIEDFVHIVYPFHSEDECKVIYLKCNVNKLNVFMPHLR